MVLACEEYRDQQRVSDDSLKSLEIFLPPLLEQRRIAGVLCGQMGSAEKAGAAAPPLRRAFAGEL